MGTVVFEFQREFAQNYNLSKNILMIIEKSVSRFESKCLRNFNLRTLGPLRFGKKTLSC